MAKNSKGGDKASKMDSQANYKLADIRGAAKSLAVPRSYEKGGYPPYPSTLHINRDKTHTTKQKGSD